jgi:hypothetical protein
MATVYSGALAYYPTMAAITVYKAVTADAATEFCRDEYNL